jgi:hypothetical protein
MAEAAHAGRAGTGRQRVQLHLWRKAQLGRMQPVEVDGQTMSPQETVKEMGGSRKKSNGCGGNAKS